MFAKDILNWLHQEPLSHTQFNDIEFSLKNVQHFLFFTTYSPLLLFCQTIWICLIVRRCAARISWWQSYLLGGFMTLAGNYIALFMTYSISPLLEHPYDILIFSFCWLAVNCSRNDILYKIFTWRPFLITLQVVFCLIQVRAVCYGCDIGIKSYPESMTGAFIVSIIYSSTDSFIWQLFQAKFPNGKLSRDFSNRVIFRNAGSAILYLYFLKNPTIFGFFEMSENVMKVYLLTVCITVAILDDIIFGVETGNGIDVTMLSYVAKLFTYYGYTEKC